MGNYIVNVLIFVKFSHTIKLSTFKIEYRLKILPDICWFSLTGKEVRMLVEINAQELLLILAIVLSLKAL